MSASQVLPPSRLRRQLPPPGDWNATTVPSFAVRTPPQPPRFSQSCCRGTKSGSPKNSSKRDATA